MRMLLAMAAAAALAAADKSPFEFRELDADSLALIENGKPAYVYNHGMMLKPGVPENRRRSSYLHPVYAPGGAIVTDDFPRDHYHHRGIFWAWPVVTVGGERVSLWDIRGIHERFVRWTARERKPGSARLAVENGWFLGEREVVKEEVEIIAHPATASERRLDVTLVFEALGGPVEIAGSPDAMKGYGGFSLRFAPRAETAIRTDSGAEPRDTDMVPHRWAELEGVFEGRRAGARIEIDASNPQFPNGWCLRHYGFLGVNFPGLKAFRMEPGQPLRMKYRVVVFNR